MVCLDDAHLFGRKQVPQLLLPRRQGGNLCSDDIVAHGWYKELLYCCGVQGVTLFDENTDRFSNCERDQLSFTRHLLCTEICEDQRCSVQRLAVSVPFEGLRDCDLVEANS